MDKDLYAVTLRDKKEHCLFEIIFYNTMFLTIFGNDSEVEYVKYRIVSWKEYIEKGLNETISEKPIQLELF